jgi:hypothetical protein
MQQAAKYNIIYNDDLFGSDNFDLKNFLLISEEKQRVTDNLFSHAPQFRRTSCAG